MPPRLRCRFFALRYAPPFTPSLLLLFRYTYYAAYMALYAIDACCYAMPCRHVYRHDLSSRHIEFTRALPFAAGAMPFKYDAAIFDITACHATLRFTLLFRHAASAPRRLRY